MAIADGGACQGAAEGSARLRRRWRWWQAQQLHSTPRMCANRQGRSHQVDLQSLQIYRHGWRRTADERGGAEQATLTLACSTRKECKDDLRAERSAKAGWHAAAASGAQQGAILLSAVSKLSHACNPRSPRRQGLCWLLMVCL